MIRPCEQCGADVHTRPSMVARGQGRFCSRKCRNQARWRKHILEISAWFWERVDDSGGADACWPWQGRRMKAGYGRLVIGGRHEGAHRVAFELRREKVATGLFVCHSCDNPPCCNPGHLFLGDHAANMRDRSLKGRAPLHKAKLTTKEVASIRKRLSCGESGVVLAREFEISPTAISRIKLGRTWTALKARMYVNSRDQKELKNG